MTDQLNLFREYKEKLKAIAGEKKAAYIIDKSIYLIVTGSDDLANTYFTAQLRRLEYDLPSYVNFVVQSASSFYQVDLYFQLCTMLPKIHITCQKSIDNQTMPDYPDI